jgi:hypothetical protein
VLHVVGLRPALQLASPKSAHHDNSNAGYEAQEQVVPVRQQLSKNTESAQIPALD